MDFLPRSKALKTKDDPYSIVQDLLGGQRFRFFNYLSQHEVFQERESQVLLTQILSARESMLWFFINEQIERELMNCLNSHPMETLLRSHFNFTKRVKSFISLRNSYYRREDSILWQLYFKDLESFGVESEFHLYQNLKFHLSLAQYGDTKKGNAQLGRILHSLYRALKLDERIPAAFLLETLKIILDFHPSHPQALFEFFEIIKGTQLKESNHNLVYWDAFDQGARDKEFLIRLLHVCKEEKDLEKLKEITQILWKEQPIHLDVDFYLEFGNCLRSLDLGVESLFFALKAYSFKSQKHSSERLLLLALASMAQEDLYLEISQKLEDVDLFIVRLEDPAQWMYRISSLESWQACESQTLLIEPIEQSKLCLQFQHRSGAEAIFYPKPTGLFQVQWSELEGIELKKRNLVSHETLNRMSRMFHFGHSSWDGSIETLQNLTPFHFQGRK